MNGNCLSGAYFKREPIFHVKNLNLHKKVICLQDTQVENVHCQVVNSFQKDLKEYINSYIIIYI